MRLQIRGNPAGGPGFERSQSKERGLQDHNTTISPADTLRGAASDALERELSVILMAAHRMAAGYGLAWDDYDRLHQAHTHMIRVLGALRDKEVLT